MLLISLAFLEGRENTTDMSVWKHCSIFARLPEGSGRRGVKHTSQLPAEKCINEIMTMSLTMVWNYNWENNINMNHLLVTQLSLIEALSVSLFCQTLLPVFSYLLSLTSPKVTFKNLQMYWRFLQRLWLLCLRRMNLNKSPGPVCLVGCVLILFWEHTGAVSASALPLPRNCHLAGRLPVLCTAQEDNEHSDRSRVSCSEYHTQAL